MTLEQAIALRLGTIMLELEKRTFELMKANEEIARLRAEQARPSRDRQPEVKAA
jgi:hypothetical protein